jgi:tRNA(adenine34) deaminase
MENKILTDDEKYMNEAIKQARFAAEIDEVPVGAVAVRDGKIIAVAFNTRETSKCATHHAEILAIERACGALGGWRLPGVTLYVTMEPCAMCAGAIVNSRIERVVYGAKDFRFGAFGSAVNLNDAGLNHTPEVVGGVLGEECADIITSYFRNKRKKGENSDT